MVVVVVVVVLVSASRRRLVKSTTVGGMLTTEVVVTTEFCALAESGAATMAPKEADAATRLPMTKPFVVNVCCFPFIVQKPVVNPLMC